METACELCNAMKILTPECACGEIMRDEGPAHDYSGPYSPYYNSGFAEHFCRHLFNCPSCARDLLVSIPLRRM